MLTAASLMIALGVAGAAIVWLVTFRDNQICSGTLGQLFGGPRCTDVVLLHQVAGVMVVAGIVGALAVVVSGRVVLSRFPR